MSEERYTTQITNDWMRARQHVKSAEERLAQAKKSLDALGCELGQRLSPGDMAEGETIGLWNRIDNHDERCFMVTLVMGRQYSVALRGSTKKIEKKL
jgi:hypothetical protein